MALGFASDPCDPVCCPTAFLVLTSLSPVKITQQPPCPPLQVLRTSLGVSSPSPATTAPLSLLLPDDVDPNDPARRAADTPRTATARLVHCGSVPGSAAAGGPSGAAPQGDGSGAGSDVPSAVLALPGGEGLVGGSDRAVHVFVPHDPGASYLMW